MNPNLDTDGQRLQAVIEKRRRELGIVPSRWRMAFFRLAILLAAVGSVIL